jgi:hypothetical protein
LGDEGDQRMSGGGQASARRFRDHDTFDDRHPAGAFIGIEGLNATAR